MRRFIIPIAMRTCCRILLLLSVLFAISTMMSAQPRLLLWDIAHLDTLRSNLQSQESQALLYGARRSLTEAPVAVTDKQASRSGDKHNFESLSIYYWPDPSNPSGPYVSRDGYYNPEYQQYDLPRINKLRANSTRFAQAFYLTRDTTFLQAFLRQIDTWFIDPQTLMNPHFEYGQFIPGRNDGKGCSAGLIDAYVLLDVLESVALVDSIAPLSAERMTALHDWFGAFAQWMQTSSIGRGEAAARNNHGAAYDVTLFYLSHFVGRTDVCDSIAEHFAERRIQTQIQPDGTQPLELRRTRAFHYSIYNLQHMVDFCIIQQRLGIDYFNTNGLCVKAALEYLQRFIGHRSDFPYQDVGDWDKEEAELKLLLQKCHALKND